VENSPAITVQGIGRVFGDMDTMGYDATWGVFSAGDVGARHERQRMWIVAYDRNTIKNTKEPERSVYAPSKDSIRAMSEGISTEPDMGRKADGLAYWMDRLQAIGNGQVPAVVRLAWQTLSRGRD
jgi:DNA (cytosine-5)-methyltransferase 1